MSCKRTRTCTHLAGTREPEAATATPPNGTPTPANGGAASEPPVDPTLNAAELPHRAAPLAPGRSSRFLVAVMATVVGVLTLAALALAAIALGVW